MKKLIINLSLVIGSILFALILAEIFLRIFIVLQPSELVPTKIAGLPYENRPSSAFTRLEKAGRWITYRKNSAGFRGSEITIAKPANIKRVLVLGDSIAFGGNVLEEETFSAVLESKLNANNSTERWQVINAGTSSYYFECYWSMLIGKGVRYQPDAVVVAVALNDCSGKSDDQSGIKKSTSAPGTMGKIANLALKIRGFLFKSFLIDNVMKVFDYKTPRLYTDNPVELKTEGDALAVYFQGKELSAVTDISRTDLVRLRHLYKRLSVFRNLDNWSHLEPTMAKFGQWSKLNQVPVYFMVFPDKLQCWPGYQDAEPENYLNAMASKHGLVPVDLLSRYRAHMHIDQTSIYYRSDYMHPKPLGHVIAAEILDSLIKR